jgi:hypothetical protein
MITITQHFQVLLQAFLRDGMPDRVDNVARSSLQKHQRDSLSV